MRTDGLQLFDPSTGRRVELEAFGSANEGVFVRLLNMKPSAEAMRQASNVPAVKPNGAAGQAAAAGAP